LTIEQKSITIARVKQFDISEIIKKSWEVLKKNYFFFVVFFIITIGASILHNIVIAILSSILSNIIPSQILSPIIFVESFIFSSFIQLANIIILIKAVKGEKPVYKDIYKHYPKFLNYILATLLFIIVVGAGFILLIIPGIYLVLRLQFMPYLAADKNINPIDALKQSWAMTNGQVLHLFKFALALVGICVLGALALLVGLIIAVPLVAVSTAYLYKVLDKSHSAKLTI
jgi:uncharacterized membrane protein